MHRSSQATCTASCTLSPRNAADAHNQYSAPLQAADIVRITTKTEECIIAES
jgi:hypothetical protein